jgi:tRNA(adenine34) deaminase
MVPKSISFIREAIRLANEAGRMGNLPIGAVIALDGEIVASGKNSIWSPNTDLTRHAEMEALRSLPSELRSRCKEMTLYTTLEPCLMCAGAILLHQIGRVVYGATDPNGGVAACLAALPPYFEHELSRMEWVGPALPTLCDSLYVRSFGMEQRRDQDSDSFFV